MSKIAYYMYLQRVCPDCGHFLLVFVNSLEVTGVWTVILEWLSNRDLN